MDGLSFGGSGDHAINIGGCHQCRYRQCDGMFRHLFQTGETSVIDLLLAAGLIKGHLFDPSGVLEVGHMRVVECKVGVLANAHEDDVGLECLQQAGIALTFVVGVWRIAIDAMDGREGLFGEDTNVEEVGEGLRRPGRQSYIFIHMKGIDLCPGDGFIGGQGGQELILGRCGGENDIHAVLCLPQLF